MAAIASATCQPPLASAGVDGSRGASAVRTTATTVGERSPSRIESDASWVFEEKAGFCRRTRRERLNSPKLDRGGAASGTLAVGSELR
jgi:hypothetical protein